MVTLLKSHLSGAWVAGDGAKTPLVDPSTEEVLAVMRDLRKVDVDILTLGQYLRPSDAHIALDRYVTPDEFRMFREAGREMGFKHVESGPLVRSSYHAWEQVQAAGV